MELFRALLSSFFLLTLALAGDARASVASRKRSQLWSPIQNRDGANKGTIKKIIHREASIAASSKRIKIDLQEAYIPNQFIVETPEALSNFYGNDVAVSENGTIVIVTSGNWESGRSFDFGSTFQMIPKALASVAMSANGSHIVAVEWRGETNVIVSDDFGCTWENSHSNRYFQFGHTSHIHLASSADGRAIFAANRGGSIYKSSDGGVTFAPSFSNCSWGSIDVSKDGRKVIAYSTNSDENCTVGVHMSSDGGLTWTASEDDRLAYSVGAISVSGDGNAFYVAPCFGHIYKSIDGGNTWTVISYPLSGGESWIHCWESISASYDGSTVAAVKNGDSCGPNLGGCDSNTRNEQLVFFTFNSGLSWQNSSYAHTTDNSKMLSVKVTADGAGIIAVSEDKVHRIASFAPSPPMDPPCEIDYDHYDGDYDYPFDHFCLAGDCNYDFLGDLDSPANATLSLTRLKERSKCPRAAGGDVMNIQATFVVTKFRSGLDDVWMHVEANYTDTSYFEGSSVYITAKFVDSTRRLKHNVGFLKWNLTQSVKQLGYIDFRTRFPDDFNMSVNSIRVKIVQFKANQKHTLDCRNYDLPETIRGFPDIEEGKTIPGCLPDCPNPWIPGNDFWEEEVYVPEIYSREECMEACKAMDGYNIVNVYNHCIHANNFCFCQKGAISYQHFNETLTHSTDPNLFWNNCYLD